MANYQLNVQHLAQKQQFTLQSGDTTKLQTQANSQYQILDQNGQLIRLDQIPKTELVGNDLFVFLEEGTLEPQLILEDYALHYSVENITALNAANTTFATVEEAALTFQTITAAEMASATSLNLFAASLATLSAAAVAAYSLHSDHNDNDNVAVNSEEPSTEEHSSEEQSAEEQSSEEQSSEEQSSEEQSAEEQSAEEHSSEEQSSEEQSAEEHSSEEQSSEEQSSEEQSSEEPSAEEQSAEEPSSEEQSAEEQSAEEQSSEEQSSEEQSSEEQSAEEQSAEEQSSEEQSSEEQSSEEIENLVAPEIRIDPITGDDIIQYVESKQATTTISGSITNAAISTAKAGDVVTIKVGETENRGVLKDDGNGGLIFEVEVGTLALINHAAEGITVSILNSSLAHQYDVDLSRDLSISLDTIAGDDVVNKAESEESLTISGKVNNGEAGDEVEIWCACASCGEGWKKLSDVALNADGSFSLNINGVELVNGITHAPSIRAILKSDETVTANRDYLVDTELSTPETTLLIAGDNKINTITESGDIAITGVLSNIDDDVNEITVTVTIDGKAYLATVNNDKTAWHLTQSGADLAKLADKNVSVTVSVTDHAGNHAENSTSQDYTVSDTLEAPIIHIDPITGDNFVNSLERDAGVTFSGRVENGIAGQTMQVGYIVKGWKFVWTDVQIQEDLTFSHTYSPEESQIILNADNRWNTGAFPNHAAAVRYTATYDDGTELKASVKTTISQVLERTDSTGESGHFLLYWNTTANEPKLQLQLDPIGENGFLNAEAQQSGYVKLTGYFHSGAMGHSGTAYADKVISATLTLNGESYSGVVTGNPLYHSTNNAQIPVEFEVPFTALSEIAVDNNGSLNLEAIVSDGYGNTKAIESNLENYTIDVIAPEISLSIDTISEDAWINLVESRQDLSVGGSLTFDETDVKAGSVEVVVNVNGVDYQAIVDENSKTWHYTFPANPNNALSNAEGTFELSASVKASDQAGNFGENSATSAFTVDLTLPEITIELNTIGDNGVINQSLAPEKTTVSGKVSGEFNVGDNITLTIGEKTYPATILDNNGNFSTDVDTTDLIANDIPSVLAVVETKDSAGNPSSAQTTANYDVVQGDIKIEITTVAGVDNFINVSEAKAAKLTISGHISGGEASPDSVVVTLTVNGKTVTATVNSDLSFSAEVDTSELLNNKGYLVKGAVSGSNNASATTAQSYLVDPYALANIDITEINSNFTAYSELGGMVTISGEVALSGLFTRGMNASAVSGFQVLIGDKSYTASLASDRKTFELKLPVAELAELNGQSISFDFGTTSNVYLPTSDSRGYYFARQNNTKITYDSITLNSDYIIDNGDGSYSVQVPDAQMTMISGVVSGQVVKTGDIVEIKLADKVYQTEVQAGNTFNLEVPAQLLAQNDNTAITATLISQDLANNEIKVSDIEAYLMPESVASTYVQPLHADIGTNARKYNHLSDNPDDYNYPYFMDMFRGAGYGYNNYNRMPFGGSDDAVIKYHFVSAEEANDVYQLNYGNSLGTHTDLDPEHQALLHRIFAKFDEYMNVRFEYSDSYIEDGTGINITKGLHHSKNAAGEWVTTTQASAFAVQGAYLMFNGWGGGGDYWGDSDWSAYISIHEILHNFGFNHTNGIFSDEYRASTYSGMGAGTPEDSTLLTYMSNKYGDKTGFYFPGYDLAALHYRYGVNPNSRAGDDVYTFQRFADAESFGGVYIWDGNGVDTFDASNEKESVYVNLTPGSWIYRGKQSSMLTVKSVTAYNVLEWFADELDQTLPVLATDTRNVKEYEEGQAFIGYGTQIENAIGSDYDDTLIGNEADNNLLGGKGNDTLKGDKGNDYLDGGEGADEMHGGEGDDTYVVDNANDKVIENADEGIDTVISFIDYTLGDNLENLTLMGATANVANGNDLDNVLIANGVGNTLNGAAGNDRLVGGLGADTLIGGEGNDTFVFNTLLNGNVDIIKDFAAGDKIELSKAIFTAIDSVENVMTYIKYDQATGELSYQESRAVDPIHFATLENLATLSSADFVLA